jgi:uncharacterized repeat protein (TIGR01451 family)
MSMYTEGATISGNTFRSNVSQGSGGGIDAGGNAVFECNHILSNTAASNGGGMHLWSTASLVNNVIADNRTQALGSGLYVGWGSPQLVHNTIARNTGGGGSGVHVAAGDGNTVNLINTILVSHTVGIQVEHGEASLEATLWGSGAWANETDWAGGGIVTGTVNVWGDPDFVDPSGGDYHIGSASAARDSGVYAGIDTDIDGGPRPIDLGYDIGADEYLGIGLEVVKRASSEIVQAGEQLTYTICVTNTGPVSLTATITDILPDHVTPGGVLTWTPTISTPNPVWTQTVVVTVDVGYVGPLTNVVQVTTEEGASGTYTETVSTPQPALTVTKRASAESVQAGKQLTYTIRVTNTGNVDLHATATDVLPSHADSAGPLTWTPTITAPGGTWEGTVVVTVGMGYAGPLTNVVQVTTEEGASGTYTETTQSQVTPKLEVTKRANSSSVQAGEQLTYTIRVTNTGNVDLHATVTDVLPSHVTSSSPLGWTPTIAAPGGVWTQTVVVTVEMGYAGPLTNVVQVTTEEGASGVYTNTCTSIGDYDIYLPLVLRQYP